MTLVDPLVEDYLRRLERAAAALPGDRRTDLVEEIREHITAALESGAGQDEAAVRTVLDRLGGPEEIVAAAREDVPPGWGTSYACAWDGGPVPPPRGTGHELAAVLLLTAGSLVPLVGWLAGVVLLWTSSLWRVREKLLGTLVVPLGPGGALLGLPLLLGRGEVCTTTGGVSTELVAPGPPPSLVVPPPDPAAPPAPPVQPGSPADLPSSLPEPRPMDLGLTTCEATGLPGWSAVPLTLLLVVAPVVVAGVLYRIARRRAAQAPPTTPRAAAPSPWEPLEVAAVVLLGVGGLVVPFAGAVVGLVLACASPRWTAHDKVITAVLALLPGVLYVTSLVLPAPAVWLPGGWEVFLPLLVTGPLAAAYLAVVLYRRSAATDAVVRPVIHGEDEALRGRIDR